MFKLFAKLFGPKGTVIDQLAVHTGFENLCIWNGISEDDPSQYLIPTSGRKHHDWTDPNFQWLMIGFGHYDDLPIIEIWINRKLEIVRTMRNHPQDPHYQYQSIYFERKIDKLYDKLNDMRRFDSTNTKLLEWTGSLFNIDPKYLYRRCIRKIAFTTFTYSEIDDILEQYAKDKEQDAEDERHLAEIRREEELTQQMAKPEPPPSKEEEDIEALLGIEHRKEKVGHH